MLRQRNFCVSAEEVRVIEYLLPKLVIINKYTAFLYDSTHFGAYSTPFVKSNRDKIKYEGE